MKKILPPKVKEFSATKQQRLDHLLEKNSEGTITPAEKARLEQLVAEAERLMVANAQLLAGSCSRDYQGERHPARQLLRQGHLQTVFVAGEFEFPFDT